MARLLCGVLWLLLGCSSSEPAAAPAVMGGAAGQPGETAGASGDESGSSLGSGGGDGGGGRSTAAGGLRDAGHAGSGASAAEDGGAVGIAGSPADSSCDADCDHCYREGHGDVFVDYATDTGLRVMLRTALLPGQSEQLYAPDAVCILVGYDRYQLVADAGGRPAGGAWDPLGVPAGTAFWQLPAISTVSTPWLGTAVATLPASHISGQSVLLELNPPAAEIGAFSAYVTSAFGTPTFLLSTTSNRYELDLEGGSHAHMNWSFTAPGRVELTLVARAETPDGTSLESQPATFRFLVREP